jgi:pimeloyl-ACP methyl ester carboxylesterase
MFIRLLAAAGLVAALAAPSQDDRGRPVILMLHGRGMLDRDTTELRKLWLRGLTSGGKLLTQQALVTDRDVRLVWYADVLDPRSSESCTYSAKDPRALREAKTDPDLKSFVSIVGNVMGAITSFVAENEAASELRSIAADASFLSDVRKRCASEQRLGDAIDRARKESRPVIVVAHSLGSIVAYDYLSSRREPGLVEQLVSVGSMLGHAGLRQLLIGGDTSDSFAPPVSVKAWINIRNEGDQLAAPLSFGKDLLSNAPADELDKHEMGAYLRNATGAGAILKGWCAAFVTKAPAGCSDVKANAP